MLTRDNTIRNRRDRPAQLVMLIFLYAYKYWTVTKNDIKNINAFETYCWRRMLRILWTTNRSNISILQELNTTIRLKDMIQQRIVSIFRNNGLEKLIKQGKMEGARRHRRNKTIGRDAIASMNTISCG